MQRLLSNSAIGSTLLVFEIHEFPHVDGILGPTVPDNGIEAGR